MKKVLRSLLLAGVALVMIFSMVGCGAANGSHTSSTADKDAALFEPDAELIACLLEYMESISDNEYLVSQKSFEDKLDELKSEKQAILVTFDPESYYYACAYLDEAAWHVDEQGKYCCRGNYTWVGVRSPNDIMEYREGKRLVASFQINSAAECSTVLPSNGEACTVEHFQMYAPAFNSYGYNSAPAVIFDSSLLYLGARGQSKHYTYAPTNSVLDYAKQNGELFVAVHLYTNDIDQAELDTRMQYEFGKYYDDLTGVMITDSYSENDGNGNTEYYGLLAIEDVARIIAE